MAYSAGIEPADSAHGLSCLPVDHHRHYSNELKCFTTPIPLMSFSHYYSSRYTGLVMSLCHKDIHEKAIIGLNRLLLEFAFDGHRETRFPGISQM